VKLVASVILLDKDPYRMKTWDHVSVSILYQATTQFSNIIYNIVRTNNMEEIRTTLIHS